MTDPTLPKTVHTHPEIAAKISSLEAALLSAHPSMPILLREIHTHLKNDPATVTLLTEAEIAIIVSGLKKQTQVAIVTAAPKVSKKSLARTTSEDLGF